jgi:hypothetical protein
MLYRKREQTIKYSIIYDLLNLALTEIRHHSRPCSDFIIVSCHTNHHQPINVLTAGA